MYGTELRNQARQLENEIETKLVAFSKLGKDANREHYGYVCLNLGEPLGIATRFVLLIMAGVVFLW